MGPVEVLQGVQGDLAGSRSFPDGRVGQRAAFAQSKDTRWKTKFAHWDCDEMRRTSSQTQEAKTVANSLRVGRNFQGVGFAVRGRVQGLTKPCRRALEVMQGEQDVRWQAKLADRFAARQFAQGLDFQVAPGAARLAGLV
jgi:hypothetical protein